LLVTGAVATVSVAGVRLLRDLADAEGLARVELAVSAARDALRQNSDDLQTAATLLGNRPTLGRLLHASNSSALATYLSQYCEAAILDACAISHDSTVTISVGVAIDWHQIIASAAEQGQRFFANDPSLGLPLSGSQAEVAGNKGVRIFVVRRMDTSIEARLSESAGLDVQVIGYAPFDADENELAALHAAALLRAAPIATRIEQLDSYAASLPVATSAGHPVALLQVTLPMQEVMRPVALQERRILLIALVVALFATTGGVVIGRFWIRGIRRLTEAARRIGSGELALSIPPERSAELGVLASTMEEMRRNLVNLTDEIRRREAQAQAVLGGIVEGVYAVDRKRRIRFLNPQAEKLLNRSAEDAFGKFCGDVLQPARDAEGRRPCEHSCPIVHAREAGAAEAVEQIGPIAGRIRRVVIASAAASDGIQVQVLRDETELEAVRRTRDTVLANISHEFRTPLAAQLASIELLRDGLGTMTAGAQRQLVLSVERGAKRLTWLIDNLLESVRIESGQLGIRRHRVDLDDVVREARELIGPLIQQRNQQLDIMPLSGLPTVRGDRQRLIQVMVNLLANASKFAPQKSVIRVGGNVTDDGNIAIWVDDEGPGPEDPDDRTLFEQFRRSGGEDPEESGLGLGLYIVNSIVERHGGRVRLARTIASRTRAEVELPMNQKA
jgi:signal transduction histidine kinase/HAMP domain-containing protein